MTKTDDTDSVSSELFGAEQMQEHGRTLALSHQLDYSKRHYARLLSRLEENEAVLDDVRRLLTAAVSENRHIVPAADWLLDNFYLIQEHIRISKRDLPKGYSKKLPRLQYSTPAGLPRVYDLALEHIAHCDGLVDPETLPGYISAYQSISILTLGELWAIPIMLRLALIENLRRTAVRISSEMHTQKKAAAWADRMTTLSETDPKSLILLVADMARSNPPLTCAFVAELSRRLLGKGAALMLPLNWIEQRLGETGQTIDMLIQEEMQQQAYDQVSVSNIIRSLRSLGAKDWKEFVESISVVEKKLREDPSGIYSKMDFQTRDQYRHVIENIAMALKLPENSVADCAIELTLSQCGLYGTSGRSSHVGFFLLGRGRALLRKKLQTRVRLSQVLALFFTSRALPLYLGSILAVTAAVTVSILKLTGHPLPLTALTVLCASGFAVSLVNWLATLLSAPKALPRMDFSEGIPKACRTLVVIPAMLNSIPHIDRLSENLEVRYLANRDDNLFFGLLTDFLDASQEVMAHDDELISYAQQKIEELNKKYPGAPCGPFFLFHRGRQWNPLENTWMGYERKRGKLAALNELLLTGNTGQFDVMIGDIGTLRPIKYIITLDTDTLLPREAARLLVGTMAHPQNLPVHDEKTGRILEGYGILQPRVTASLPGANLSHFSRLCNSDAGIDPYTRAVSDVYQDIFGEGSYIGKGIYEVESFTLALGDRFPENRILSHDLLEGCYARAGMVSDIQLFEESPSTYQSDIQRRKRWMRGDWQLIPWLFPVVPGFHKKKAENPISMLAKWKLLDNLRRALIPPVMVALLTLGWFLLPTPLLFTLLVLGCILTPPALVALAGFLKKPRDMDFRLYLSIGLREGRLHLAPALFTVVTLPYEAWYSLTTILRTAWRLLITHRHLLEWQASSHNDVHSRPIFTDSLRAEWFSPAFAAVTAVFLILTAPAKLLFLFPILLLWFIEPFISWSISRPLPSKKDSLSAKQNIFLRRIARKTWAFFETFVTAAENWLPPDNFQEIPAAKIAHRTSPTNIGLSLLANLAAYDFGLIPSGTLLTRTAGTLYTIDRMEKHRTHLFNWYDTLSLQPLTPRYVSTVDSGNLSAHLLTLSSALTVMSAEPIFNENFWKSLEDTGLILGEYLDKDVPEAYTLFTAALAGITLNPPRKISDIHSAILGLHLLTNSIIETSTARMELQLQWWADALSRQCLIMIEEIELLYPCCLRPALFTGYPELEVLDRNISLVEILEATESLLRQEHDIDAEFPAEMPAVLDLTAVLELAHGRAMERLSQITLLAEQTGRLAVMDFTFLYNKKRNLFTIGYAVDSHRSDTGFYDLLASEARLVSFIAIAFGQIPQENWFALGRLLTDPDGNPILLSWSGSMFEYLMPLLVMPSFEKTILDQTCVGAVECQIAYGSLRGVPWGISESGYNLFDVSLNYQYRAFGVPSLGLKRGLMDDLVIAPYASALALLVLPEAAGHNLQRLSEEGFEGDYGFYEAVDYTKARVLSGHSAAIVRSFMAHHQGMSFLAIASHLHGQKMQNRFARIPAIRATILLLEEKIPRTAIIHTNHNESLDLPTRIETPQIQARNIRKYDTMAPEVQILSNGKYHVMVTNSGGGYSRWKELSLTRWREDTTCDHWGSFVYIKDIKTGEFWSNTFQPTGAHPDSYEAIFSEGRAEFRRRDNDLETYTEIVVSPEDDIELRRIRITNRSRGQRTIEVTSYAEVVLTPAENDSAHPCFSNLFMQSEILTDKDTLLFTRRKRSPTDYFPCLLHLMNVRNSKVIGTSFETDRLLFIGRGRTSASPLAMQNDAALSDSQGSVLDPVASIRKRVIIDSDASVTIDLITGISATRDAALLLAEKYGSRRFANRAFELARTHSQIVLQQLNALEEDAYLYIRLAGKIIYTHAQMRADTANILANRRGQSGLWGYSISGDLPIVLLQIKDPANIILVHQLVQAHSYWHQKGLEVDLVIWNEEHGSYRQVLQEQILSLVTSEASTGAKPGGIFLRSADQISTEDRILIQTVARVIISDTLGTLEEQISKPFARGKAVSHLIPHLLIAGRKKNKALDIPAKPPSDLQFANGCGGFSADGKEYLITVTADTPTPMPWTNVIANPGFGTVVSESGMAYTWSGNAHEFRISPWHNDPVSDISGEALYIRDEDSGAFWSPTALPKPGKGDYNVRHGFGYSVFEHSEQGIRSELWIYVAKEDPVKFMRLILRNDSGRVRRISASCYCELVLGDLRAKNAMHIITEQEPLSGALFAQNRYNTEYPENTVFMDAGAPTGAPGALHGSHTGDRSEFLGRNGSISKPDALTRHNLSGRTGAKLDPCLAIQIPVTLAVREKTSIVFTLGAAGTKAEALALVQKSRLPNQAAKELQAVQEYWNKTTETVQVETPDAALNVLANGWLVYQVLSSRLWGRSGFYQSGGAFGFRDQLQDVMSLIHIDSALAREHILLCASRQFPEGDVQHWWHPPHGQGTRTHCSDDYLWLPLAVARYVSITGDSGILDEEVSFIEGRFVNDDEESYYDKPMPSALTATVFEHCARAINHGLNFGAHGLPLMGSGDWNDGMNMVGIQGTGESVWLGFFLYSVLLQFSDTAQEYGKIDFAAACREKARDLQVNLESSSWDGSWYRRAWFDNGEILGSRTNQECRIDSISQSWAVLSGAGEPERSRQAMASLDELLVQREEGLIKLLVPPFDKGDLNPGYIKGYVPGVRENGGQYTHSAVWAAMAFAKLGNSEKAWQLFGIINPVNHSDSPEKTAVYKVEPYVLAADVYSVFPHSGQGGWTWYTGSAGWMYRLILESLLGFTVRGNVLSIKACLPPDWTDYKITYRYRETVYHIKVTQAQETAVLLDGIPQSGAQLLLSDDHRDHHAQFRLSAPRAMD